MSVYTHTLLATIEAPIFVATFYPNKAYPINPLAFFY